MTIPATYIGAAQLLEACEDILSDRGILRALALATNDARGADPLLSPVPDVAVEIAPESADQSFPPQSFPSVRLDVVGTEVVHGVNNGVARALHTVGVRVFVTTPDRISTLDAKGKRTILTTATLRARLQAQLVWAALSQRLVGASVNGVSVGVYNVLAPRRFDVRPYQDDLGFVAVCVFDFDVWQQVRSLRFGYDSGVTLEEYAIGAGAAVVWRLGDFASTGIASDAAGGSLTLIRSGGTVDASWDDPVYQGTLGRVAVRDGSGGPYTSDFADLGSTADRTVEFVFDFEDQLADGVLFRSLDPDSLAGPGTMGEIKLDAGSLVYVDPDGGETDLIINTALIVEGKPIMVHVVYTDGGGFDVYARWPVSPLGNYTTTSLSVSHTPVAPEEIKYRWNGVANAQPNFNLHHTAIYNEAVDATHRSAVYALAGMT